MTTVTVFGGTGFLGRTIVAHLTRQGVSLRVAVRHPDRAPAELRVADSVETVRADVRDAASVRAALVGADAAVNAVGLYVEQGDATFDAVHVRGAEHVAQQAAEAGVGRLLHVSGIGADPTASSPFVRARGQGEDRVRAAFPAATVFRPSVMFGPDDSLLHTLDLMTRLAPVVPLFGNGRTQLQPVFVGDVAAAAHNVLTRPAAAAGVYELGGPDVFTYRELVSRVLEFRGRRRALLPWPFPAWRTLAAAAEHLPGTPLTRDQVNLMRRDNVVRSGARTFADLDMVPQRLDDLLPLCLGA